MNKKSLWVLIGILILIIILLWNCGNPGSKTVVYSNSTDTLYITKDSIIYKDSLIPVPDIRWYPGDSVYVPDSLYEGLLKQYTALVERYRVRNYYQDSLPIDSFGMIYIDDTVQYNTIKNRKYTLDYSVPIITNTIVQEPTNLFYVGGGASFQNGGFKQIQFGGLYKPGKKTIYGIHLGTDLNGKIYGGGSVYRSINGRNRK